MVVEVGGKARLQLLLLLPRKCPKMSGCVAWVPHPYLPPLPHLSLSRFCYIYLNRPPAASATTTTTAGGRKFLPPKERRKVWGKLCEEEEQEVTAFHL